MYSNYIYNNVNDALPVLLADLLAAPIVESRAGKTRESTHIGITLRNPTKRKELILPSRKANLAAQIAETMWVLAGRDDVGWLSLYLPRAADFSDDGKTWRGAYGARLRHWGDGDIDQLRWVVQKLRGDRNTRQAVIQIYDPALDDEVNSKDIPCNNWITFCWRDRLDMHVGLRSNDAMWGWSGINHFEWTALLEIVANMVGAEPGALHFSTTSFHLYERHWAKAERITKDQVRESRLESPAFNMPEGQAFVHELDNLIKLWFMIERDIRHHGTSEAIKSDIRAFPEPMMRSWLAVIYWWWTQSDDLFYDLRLEYTYLFRAAKVGLQPKQVTRDEDRPEPDPFLKTVLALHDEKTKVYGDSWRKRGEVFSIMPNIARKVDRLGRAGAGDSELDTTMDLCVYLAKYITWLDDQVGENIEPVLSQLSQTVINDDAHEFIRKMFEHLLSAVSGMDTVHAKKQLAWDLLVTAWPLARYLWVNQQVEPGPGYVNQ